jgi:hypothetical protein
MYPRTRSALKDIAEGRGETVDQTKVLAVLILSTWAIDHKLPDMVRLVQKNKRCRPNPAFHRDSMSRKFCSSGTGRTVIYRDI